MATHREMLRGCRMDSYKRDIRNLVAENTELRKLLKKTLPYIGDMDGGEKLRARINSYLDVSPTMRDRIK